MWDVSVCVACLATEVKMYSLSANSLLQPYLLLAGVQFGGLPGYLPKKLCWECAALVNKFNLFRHKCERAYLLLQNIYNQHDEILEEHVNNEINREQRLLSSPLSITHIPSYTVNGRNVATIKDKSIEHLTYSVKPEVDIVKVEFCCPKSEPGFKNEPFVNDDMVENLEDDDGEEGVENDMKRVTEPEGHFKFELNVTKKEAPPRPSVKKETIPPDAWTGIIFTQEQVNELYKQKKNSLEYEKAALKCQLCYQVFKQPQYYQKHMLKHEPSAGSYQCDFCKIRYKTRKYMGRHMKVHIINYKCNICGAKKHSRDLAKAHYLRHKKLEAALKLRRKKSLQRAQDKREAAAAKRRASESKRKVKTKLKRNKMLEYEAVQSFLNQEQMMEVIRDRQLVKSYDTAPFKCHLCYKVFLENRTYSQHMTLHDPVRGEYECDICKIRLGTRKRVQKHITSSHLRKYTCNICSNVSYNRGVAKDHYQQHKRVRYMCHVCAATFREPAMQMHVLAKHPSFVACNVCGECGTYFPTYRGLACHRNHMHKVATLPEENAPYCEHCKVQFVSTKAWTKHVLNSDRHKDLQKDIVNGCRQCGEVFPTKLMLKKHKKEHHPDKKQSRHQVRNPASRTHSTHHSCALCGEQMTSSQRQWAHYRRCHPGQPYPRLTPANFTCDQCSKGFNAKSLLEQHRVMHSGPPPLQCNICPKAFYMQSALKHHALITHSDVSPYKCDNCDMSFKQKGALKRHLLVHTGGRPFPCTACEKAFTTRQWLQLHIRKVHNKEHIPTKPRIRKRKPPV